jgi:hypothetical protein
MTETNLNLDQLENDIMKVIYAKPGESFSQFKIYDTLLEKYDVKDLKLKEDLKIKLLTIMRVLPYIFDNVKVINKYNSLYAIVEDNDSNNGFKEIVPDNIPSIEVLSNEMDHKMPNEMDVINFILKENLDDYIFKKDYMNNTILQILIDNNEYDKVDKYFNKLKVMIYDENNEKKNPLKYINTFKINNLFVNDLYSENRLIKNEFLLLKDEINKIKDQNIRMNNNIYFQGNIIKIMICILVSIIYRFYF